MYVQYKYVLQHVKADLHGLVSPTVDAAHYLGQAEIDGDAITLRLDHGGMSRDVVDDLHSTTAWTNIRRRKRWNQGIFSQESTGAHWSC